MGDRRGSQLNQQRIERRNRQLFEATCLGCGKIHQPASWELIDLKSGDTIVATDDYEVVLGWGQDEALQDLTLVEFDAEGIAYDVLTLPKEPVRNRASRRKLARSMAGRRGPHGKVTGEQTRQMRRQLTDMLRNDPAREAEVAAEAAAQ